MKIETLQALLLKQEAKLHDLNHEFDALINSNPRIGHGGTPNITDNSKGRQMIRVCERLDERLRSKDKQIEEQKEKIQRTKNRILYAESKKEPTKKAVKFLEKNEIHKGLLKLQEEGKLKQWERKPFLFFVVGLERVALLTVKGKVGVSAKYPYKTDEEKNICKSLIAEIESD
jgi:hypothetical protein